MRSLHIMNNAPNRRYLCKSIVLGLFNRSTHRRKFSHKVNHHLMYCPGNHSFKLLKKHKKKYLRISTHLTERRREQPPDSSNKDRNKDSDDDIMKFLNNNNNNTAGGDDNMHKEYMLNTFQLPSFSGDHFSFFKNDESSEYSKSSKDGVENKEADDNTFIAFFQSNKALKNDAFTPTFQNCPLLFSPSKENVQQPEVIDKQPEVRPSQPEVIIKQPEVKAKQPEVKARQPEVKARQPEVKVKQPEVKVKQPEVKVKQPEVKARQPEFKARQLGIRAKQPVVKVKQPVIKMKQSEVKILQPEVKIKQTLPDASKRDLSPSFQSSLSLFNTMLNQESKPEIEPVATLPSVSPPLEKQPEKQEVAVVPKATVDADLVKPPAKLPAETEVKPKKATPELGLNQTFVNEVIAKTLAESYKKNESQEQFFKGILADIAARFNTMLEEKQDLSNIDLSEAVSTPAVVKSEPDEKVKETFLSAAKKSQVSLEVSQPSLIDSVEDKPPVVAKPVPKPVSKPLALIPTSAGVKPQPAVPEVNVFDISISDSKPSITIVNKKQDADSIKDFPKADAIKSQSQIFPKIDEKMDSIASESVPNIKLNQSKPSAISIKSKSVSHLVENVNSNIELPQIEAKPVPVSAVPSVTSPAAPELSIADFKTQCITKKAPDDLEEKNAPKDVSSPKGDFKQSIFDENVLSDISAVVSNKNTLLKPSNEPLPPKKPNSDAPAASDEHFLQAADISAVIDRIATEAITAIKSVSLGTQIGSPALLDKPDIKASNINKKSSESVEADCLSKVDAANPIVKLDAETKDLAGDIKQDVATLGSQSDSTLKPKNPDSNLCAENLNIRDTFPAFDISATVDRITADAISSFKPISSCNLMSSVENSSTSDFLDEALLADVAESSEKSKIDVQVFAEPSVNLFNSSDAQSWSTDVSQSFEKPASEQPFPLPASSASNENMYGADYLNPIDGRKIEAVPCPRLHPTIVLDDCFFGTVEADISAALYETSNKGINVNRCIVPSAMHSSKSASDSILVADMAVNEKGPIDDIIEAINDSLPKKILSNDYFNSVLTDIITVKDEIGSIGQPLVEEDFIGNTPSFAIWKNENIMADTNDSYITKLESNNVTVTNSIPSAENVYPTDVLFDLRNIEECSDKALQNESITYIEADYVMPRIDPGNKWNEPKTDFSDLTGSVLNDIEILNTTPIENPILEDSILMYPVENELISKFDVAHQSDVDNSEVLGYDLKDYASDQSHVITQEEVRKCILDLFREDEKNKIQLKADKCKNNNFKKSGGSGSFINTVANHHPQLMNKQEPVKKNEPVITREEVRNCILDLLKEDEKKKKTKSNLKTVSNSNIKKVPVDIHNSELAELMEVSDTNEFYSSRLLKEEVEFPAPAITQEEVRSCILDLLYEDKNKNPIPDKEDKIIEIKTELIDKTPNQNSHQELSVLEDDAKNIFNTIKQIKTDLENTVSSSKSEGSDEKTHLATQEEVRNYFLDLLQLDKGGNNGKKPPPKPHKTLVRKSDLSKDNLKAEYQLCNPVKHSSTSAEAAAISAPKEEEISNEENSGAEVKPNSCDVKVTDPPESLDTFLENIDKSSSPTEIMSKIFEFLSNKKRNLDVNINSIGDSKSEKTLNDLLSQKEKTLLDSMFPTLLSPRFDKQGMENFPKGRFINEHVSLEEMGRSSLIDPYLFLKNENKISSQKKAEELLARFRELEAKTVTFNENSNQDEIKSLILETFKGDDKKEPDHSVALESTEAQTGNPDIVDLIFNSLEFNAGKMDENLDFSVDISSKRNLGNLFPDSNSNEKQNIEEPRPVCTVKTFHTLTDANSTANDATNDVIGSLKEVLPDPETYLDVPYLPAKENHDTTSVESVSPLLSEKKNQSSMNQFFPMKNVFPCLDDSMDIDRNGERDYDNNDSDSLQNFWKNLVFLQDLGLNEHLDGHAVDSPKANLPLLIGKELTKVAGILPPDIFTNNVFLTIVNVKNREPPEIIIIPVNYNDADFSLPKILDTHVQSRKKRDSDLKKLMKLVDANSSTMKITFTNGPQFPLSKQFSRARSRFCKKKRLSDENKEEVLVLSPNELINKLLCDPKEQSGEKNESNETNDNDFEENFGQRDSNKNKKYKNEKKWFEKNPKTEKPIGHFKPIVSCVKEKKIKEHAELLTVRDQQIIKELLKGLDKTGSTENITPGGVAKDIKNLAKGSDSGSASEKSGGSAGPGKAASGGGRGSGKDKSPDREDGIKKATGKNAAPGEEVKISQQLIERMKKEFCGGPVFKTHEAIKECEKELARSLEKMEKKYFNQGKNIAGAKPESAEPERSKPSVSRQPQPKPNESPMQKLGDKSNLNTRQITPKKPLDAKNVSTKNTPPTEPNKPEPPVLSKSAEHITNAPVNTAKKTSLSSIISGQDHIYSLDLNLDPKVVKVRPIPDEKSPSLKPGLNPPKSPVDPKKLDNFSGQTKSKEQGREANVKISPITLKRAMIIKSKGVDISKEKEATSSNEPGGNKGNATSVKASSGSELDLRSLSEGKTVNIEEGLPKEPELTRIDNTKPQLEMFKNTEPARIKPKHNENSLSVQPRLKSIRIQATATQKKKIENENKGELDSLSKLEKTKPIESSKPEPIPPPVTPKTPGTPKTKSPPDPPARNVSPAKPEQVKVKPTERGPNPAKPKIDASNAKLDRKSASRSGSPEPEFVHPSVVEGVGFKPMTPKTPVPPEVPDIVPKKPDKVEPRSDPPTKSGTPTMKKQPETIKTDPTMFKNINIIGKLGSHESPASSKPNTTNKGVESFKAFENVATRPISAKEPDQLLDEIGVMKTKDSVDITLDQQIRPKVEERTDFADKPKSRGFSEHIVSQTPDKSPSTVLKSKEIVRKTVLRPISPKIAETITPSGHRLIQTKEPIHNTVSRLIKPKVVDPIKSVAEQAKISKLSMPKPLKNIVLPHEKSETQITKKTDEFAERVPHNVSPQTIKFAELKSNLDKKPLSVNKDGDFGIPVQTPPKEVETANTPKKLEKTLLPDQGEVVDATPSQTDLHPLKSQTLQTYIITNSEDSYVLLKNKKAQEVDARTEEMRKRIKARVMEKMQFENSRKSEQSKESLLSVKTDESSEDSPCLLTPAQEFFTFSLDKISKEVIPLLDPRKCKTCQVANSKIMEFPLFNPKKESMYKVPKEGIITIDAHKNVMLKTELKTIPSVTTVLNSTMSDQSKAALSRWRSSMISQLGEEGFKIFYKDQLRRGSEFHEIIQAYLRTFNHNQKLSDSANLCFKSVSDVLKNISDVTVLESHVIHPLLAYRGVIDCVAKYKDKPVIIEWKKSDKPKPTVRHTYDAPLQLSAYMGALNYDKSYPIQVEGAVVIIAYSDGTPADVFSISAEECDQYWKQWLERFKMFMSAHQAFPLSDV